MRVLIVEDDPLVQTSLGRLLRRQFDDCDLRFATNANLGIAWLAAGEVDGAPIDFVICDYNLDHGQTGGQVLAWIREHMSRLENRFLFLTDDDRAQAMHRHFLRKPATSAEIRAAINSLLNRS